MTKNNYFSLLIAAGLIVLSGITHKKINKPKISYDMQFDAVNFNVDFIKLFSLGQKRVIVDSMWIKTMLDSDLEWYKGEALKNWMFLRFDAMIKIDPKFYQPYRYGGLYLSVVKNDTPGAESIFKDGLELYPNDYYLNFFLGILYLDDKRDYELGAKYLSKVQNDPRAPAYLPNIVAKARAQSGDPELAFQLLLVKYKTIEGTDSPVAQRLFNTLYALRAEIDLGCLNSKAASNCKRVDMQGNPYLQNNGIWIAPKEWKKARIRNKKRQAQ